MKYYRKYRKFPVNFAVGRHLLHAHRPDGPVKVSLESGSQSEKNKDAINNYCESVLLTFSTIAKDPDIQRD